MDPPPIVRKRILESFGEEADDSALHKAFDKIQQDIVLYARRHGSDYIGAELSQYCQKKMTGVSAENPDDIERGRVSPTPLRGTMTNELSIGRASVKVPKLDFGVASRGTAAPPQSGSQPRIDDMLRSKKARPGPSATHTTSMTGGAAASTSAKHDMKDTYGEDWPTATEEERLARSNQALKCPSKSTAKVERFDLEPFMPKRQVPDAESD